MEHSGHHFIGIIGGSVSGSEAAVQLAEKGFRVVVFDQMALPYGKIEDGLPKWHEKLRDKEEANIDQKLMHPNIRYVPNTRLGRDIAIKDLVDNWGFSAVLLATGAWRDRPLPIEGIDKYKGKGLIYQNEMIKWFNHCHEPGYEGPLFDIPDGVAVVGGGLASIDVIKIIMIKTVQEKLLERGIAVDLFTMERGIDRVLDKYELTMEDLGLNGATLFYRRTSYDMPLKPYTREDQRAKAREVSHKMLGITQRKYKFNFSPLSIPEEIIEQDGQLKGIIFKKAEIVDGRVIPIEGSEFEFKTDLLVSSIGSLPEPLKGLPFKNSLIETDSKNSCKVSGYDNVFAIGNAVTGRGNIAESRLHGRESAQAIMETHLEWDEEQFKDLLRGLESSVDQQVSSISKHLKNVDVMPDEVIEGILKNTKDLQIKAGYNGNYEDWKKENLPVRLENMPGKLDESMVV
jgi:NADPH-dependent glutamate synthase beta subunit-like oxidoreductase